MGCRALQGAVSSLPSDRVLTVSKTKPARESIAFSPQCLHQVTNPHVKLEISAASESQDNQEVIKTLVSSPHPSTQDLPGKGLSHIAGELVFCFPYCAYSLGTKKRSKLGEAGSHGTSQTGGESCAVKPGRSKGIVSRRGAAVFPPVPLKHNSWISVSEAVSLLSV